MNGTYFVDLMIRKLSCWFVHLRSCLQFLNGQFIKTFMNESFTLVFVNWINDLLKRFESKE